MNPKQQNQDVVNQLTAGLQQALQQHNAGLTSMPMPTNTQPAMVEPLGPSKFPTFLITPKGQEEYINTILRTDPGPLGSDAVPIPCNPEVVLRLLTFLINKTAQWAGSAGIASNQLALNSLHYDMWFLYGVQLYLLQQCSMLPGSAPSEPMPTGRPLQYIPTAPPQPMQRMSGPAQPQAMPPLMMPTPQYMNNLTPITGNNAQYLPPSSMNGPSHAPSYPPAPAATSAWDSGAAMRALTLSARKSHFYDGTPRSFPGHS